jgi:hypothetical protein
MNNHTLRGVATAGLLGILGACAPMTPQERRVADEKLLGLALGVGGRARANPGVAWAGDAIVSSTNAEQGRTQVIVNDYVPPAPTPGRVEAVIVDKNTGKSYTLTGRSDESVADAMRRSPEFQREGRGYEFKRQQVLNAGVILYEPVSGQSPEEPFNAEQMFSRGDRISAGFFVPQEALTDRCNYFVSVKNLNTMQKVWSNQQTAKGDSVLVSTVAFSGGLWARPGERYFELTFDSKAITDIIGTGREYMAEVYFSPEPKLGVDPKATYQRKFIIENR